MHAGKVIRKQSERKIWEWPIGPKVPSEIPVNVVRSFNRFQEAEQTAFGEMVLAPDHDPNQRHQLVVGGELGIDCMRSGPYPSGTLSVISCANRAPRERIRT